MERLAPFWSALANHARPLFTSWTGMKIDRIQKRAIADLPEHVRLETQLPATLIHNDFNPRNVALRRGDDTLRLCAYDWELARPGLPQHDLAEFLCFVLPANVDRAMCSRSWSFIASNSNARRA